MGIILYRECKPRLKLTTVGYENLVAVEWYSFIGNFKKIPYFFSTLYEIHEF